MQPTEKQFDKNEKNILLPISNLHYKIIIRQSTNASLKHHLSQKLHVKHYLSTKRVSLNYTASEQHTTPTQKLPYIILEKSLFTQAETRLTPKTFYLSFPSSSLSLSFSAVPLLIRVSLRAHNDDAGNWAVSVHMRSLGRAKSDTYFREAGKERLVAAGKCSRARARPRDERNWTG